MVSGIGIRGMWAVFVSAVLLSIVVACDSEQVQFYLTPTMSGPGEVAIPLRTVEPVVAATPLSDRSDAVASTLEADDDQRPVVVASTPQQASRSEIPEGYFLAPDEAMAAGERLGCSGWSNVRIEEVGYYRPCADDAAWERVRLDADGPLASSNSATATATSAAKFIPSTVRPDVPSTPMPDQAVAPTAPPYHFATPEEAVAGAETLGCSGWTSRMVEGVSYYRACSDNRDFEILSSGKGVTLTGEACDIESDPTARFTAAPTDIENIASIVPAGSPIGGVIKPHSYIFNRETAGQPRYRAPVYAVADSVLTAISYYSTSHGTGEYLLFFDVTCEISFKFDHLSEVAPKIAAIAPDVPAQGSATTQTEPISFEAGDIIGWSVGAAGQGPWDFGAYDLTHTNRFANQDRYEKGRMSQLLHTVCPYEYFVEPLRSQLLSLLGTHSQEIKPDIPCYTSERDVIGAASGAWFDSQVLEFSDSSFSAALLAGDYVGITGIGSDMRIAKGEPTWLDPALLTDSHCYASGGRWIFIEIQGDGTIIKAVDGTGVCPSSLPAGARIFYR